MRGQAELSDPHAAAIEEAYGLIELVQGQDDRGRVAVADATAAAHGWSDVRILMDFARSLAALEAGVDGSVHVNAMVERATALDDPVLLALAWATNANRRTIGRWSATAVESSAIPLVRAIALLDAEGGPVVHRAAALIEVASVLHELGLWELASEQYALAEQALAADHDLRWKETARRQRRAVRYNQTDLALDWACAHAGVGDWLAASSRAAATLHSTPEPVDEEWPPGWIAENRAHRQLLAALAGLGRPGEGTGEFGAAVTALDRAIRATRTGDQRLAAELAGQAVDRFRSRVPINVHLLSLSLAARHPATPPVAIRYADEMAALRWHNRLDRLSSIRDAIAVERRRREHDWLQRQVLVDELTGLANRRGYHTYVAGVLDRPSHEAGHGEVGHREGYAVMMIDVDHFKAVNDHFGHDTGDAVLSRIGGILAGHVRSVDLAARLGGDEFVIILADVTPGIPERRAQSIIDAVRDHPWSDLAPGLAVSISVGVHRGRRQELPALLTSADRQLYHAKNRGRGRVATQTG